MHDIEPHYGWREYYIASEDESSPFFGRVYSEFSFSQKIYNYFIHPQWDDFGSSTLYMKILFVDKVDNYAIIELIGEWNDCIHNDVMFLKRNITDLLIDQGVTQFILICENVLNFHSSDDSYYEEWYNELAEYNGWITIVNPHEHVLKEMESIRLQNYLQLSEIYMDMQWRKKSPKHFYQELISRMNNETKQLTY